MMQSAEILLKLKIEEDRLRKYIAQENISEKKTKNGSSNDGTIKSGVVDDTKILSELSPKFDEEQLDSNTHYKLGAYYENGYLAKKNLNKALFHYRQAMIKGHNDAQKCVRDVLIRLGNDNIKQNMDQAKEYFKQALEVIEQLHGKNSAETMNILHTLAALHIKLKNNDEAKLCNERAQVINAEIQYATANCYYYGNGGKIKDKHKAASLYHSAGILGHAAALAQLGYMYQIGSGVPRDPKLAVEFCNRAAEKNNSDGQWRLGFCYAMGDGVTIDQIRAVHYYKLAADQGNPVAHFHLGGCYQTGNGIIQNESLAIHHYQVSAGLGYEAAQIKLEKLLAMQQIRKNPSNADNSTAVNSEGLVHRFQHLKKKKEEREVVSDSKELVPITVEGKNNHCTIM